jgi:hypothetical protein
MAYKRIVRKVAKKVGRAVKRRYFQGKGYSNPKIGQMVKDISVLKSMVNAEKKRLEVPISTGQLVGQVNAANSGHWIADLTPNVTQGSGYNQKTGNSFKWHSSFLDFQFQQQTSVSSPIRLKIEIVKVVGLPYTTVSDILGKYIEPTSFTSGTIYDIHSPRDPDYYKNFIVLKRKFVYLPMDNTSGQLMLKRVKMGIKYKNHHVRTNNNDPTITMGQVFMLITADNGNCNGSTVSTITGIPNAGTNTGATFLGEFTHYYYDN